jgi:membrane fusion protein (multidrug efflux system)
LIGIFTFRTIKYIQQGDYMVKPLRGSRWLCWLSGFWLSLAGCGERLSLPPPEGMPVMAVLELKAQPIELSTALPGRTVPYRIAEVRPQVGGLILERKFTEGSQVQAGQTLYQIDPSTYRANYDTAVASLAKARATLRTARLKADRFRQLAEIQAVSSQDRDDAVAALGQAEADVATGKASVESARIELQFARVQAPISGRIGRSTVTQGALVTAHQNDAMATIQQLDPIYVDVTQPSLSLLRLKLAVARGELKQVDARSVSVALRLEDGSTYPLSGQLAFSETTVNQSTGAITLRAVFPNPNADLLPGMYVHAILQEGINQHALLVPQQAVMRNHAGQPTAYVVGADHKLQLRTLAADRTVGQHWLVRSGVRPGEQLVVEGLTRAREGLEVRTVPWAASTTVRAQPHNDSAPALASNS